jgi:hypothetical protein
MHVDTGRASDLAFSGWDIGSLVQFGLYEVQVWMGDAILVYRVYYISRKKIRYIVFPCVLCVGSMFCAINLLHSIIIEDVLNPASVARANSWAIPTYIMTLTENIYCAAMITFHIWGTRHVQYLRQSRLGPVLRIFIECAGFWIVLIFTSFILFLANIPAYIIMQHLTNPALGICFCIMTARLYLLTQDVLVSRGRTNRSSTTAFPPMESGRSIPLNDLRHSSETKRAPESFGQGRVIVIE